MAHEAAYMTSIKNLPQSLGSYIAWVDHTWNVCKDQIPHLSPLLNRKVLDIDETVNDPHMRHREMIVEVDNPRFGKSKQIGFPIKFSETPWQLRMGAAKLGDHTNEVLSELGYTVEEIEQLQKERVVC